MNVFSGKQGGSAPRDGCARARPEDAQGTPTQPEEAHMGPVPVHHPTTPPLNFYIARHFESW